MIWSLSMRRRIVKVAAVFALVAVLATGLNVLFSRGVHGSGTGSGSCGPGGCGGGLICPVIFEAMLGSGEDKHYAGPNNLTWQESPELYTVYKKITFPPNYVNSDGLPVPEISVPYYPAAPVTTLLHGIDLPGNINNYLDSEKVGVTALSAAIAEALHTCSTTKFILAGYSQGAMVVHDFLDQLAVGSDSPLQRVRQASIIGAVLVADPDRVKYSAVPELATAPSSGYGVCDVVSTLHIAQCPSDRSLQDVASMFLNRTVSVCAFDDGVCDTSDLIPSGIGSLGNPIVVTTAIARGYAIHTSYGRLAATGNAGTVMSRLLAATI